MKKMKIQGVQRECYPLVPAQKMHFYTVMTCQAPQVLNIGTGIYIQYDVDFEMLRKAIYEAYQRCESSRLRFHKDKKDEIWQYIVPEETREIELHDYRHWKEEDVHSRLTDYTKIPFEMYDSPLNRAIMVQMPDGYNGIYFNVQHMTMDSSSLFIFLRDILEIYCARMYPDQVEMPGEMQSYIECLKKDLEYPDSKSYKKDQKYWASVLEEPEPMYTDFAGNTRLKKAREESGNPDKRSCSVVGGSNEAQITVYSLEADSSQKLMDFCAEKNVPMVCLLMMGLRTVLSIFNDEEKDISIKTTVARRGTLLETKSGGTRIHFFPCRTIVEPEDTFLDGIHKIQHAQNTIFRHANYDPIQYTMERAKALKLERGESYESISLTYQPMSGQNGNRQELPASYKTMWYSNGVAAQPIYLTVMHRATDNGLDFYFEHRNGIVSKEEMDNIYYYICRILFSGIEHCDESMRDVLKLV